MMDIDWIVSRLKQEAYYFSSHADMERMNDNLLISEIEESILGASVLENYPNDKRGDSCLLVGFTKAGKPIHSVCGKSGNDLVIITVYIPTPPKFITPYERSS